MRKPLIALAFLVFLALPKASHAETLYVAQSAAGGDTGANCANAHSVTWFNAAANWGGGAGEIDANDSLRLCGTFTGTAGQVSMLTCPANVGTAGNPVTIESDISDPAIFTATYWGGTTANDGAVIRCAYGNVTIDGHNVGIVKATANGTALANQQDSGNGIVAGNASTGSSGITVRNWTVQDMYVHTGAGDDLVGDATNGIRINCTSDCTLSGNTVNDAYVCGAVFPFGTGSGAYIFSNVLHACHNPFLAVPLSNGTWTTYLIHDNNMYDTANWDTTSNTFHNELIHFFGAGGVTATVNDAQVYNNYFHGNLGSHTTAMVYVEDPGVWDNMDVFNNLFVLETGSATDGMYVTLTAGTSFLNNTLVNATGSQNNIAFSTYNSVAHFQNNVIQRFGKNIYNVDLPLVITGTWDKQWYWDAAANPFTVNAGATSFTNWKSGQSYSCNCDANSSNEVASPNFTSNYHLNSGSPLIAAGANLTSLASTLSIPALLLDKDGVARPGGATAWDIGAYQFEAGGSSPAPPHHLTVIIN